MIGCGFTDCGSLVGANSTSADVSVETSTERLRIGSANADVLVERKSLGMVIAPLSMEDLGPDLRAGGRGQQSRAEEIILQISSAICQVFAIAVTRNGQRLALEHGWPSEATVVWF